MVLFLFAADNVKLSRDGSTITIVNVQPDNDGTYRCVASNPFGITHTIVSLIVKGKDTFDRGAPPSGRAMHLFLCPCPQTLRWPSSPLPGLYGSRWVNPSTWNVRRPGILAPQCPGTDWTATVRPC